MARIFISYRRSDEPDSVGRVRDRLRAFYGKNAIFRDIDGIPKGRVFRTVIEKELKTCKFLLVVIGPHWVDATDGDGNRRLLKPDDWVRTEVEAGLARTDLRVVPVLVGGAQLPTPDQLPESMRGLLEWNAAWLRDDSFDQDFEVLTHDLGGVPRRRWLFGGSVAGALLLAVGTGFFVLHSVGGAAKSPSPPTAAVRATASTTTTTLAPMDGGFNVAVADFTAKNPSDKTDQEQARLLATRVTRRLTTMLGTDGTGSDIQIRGPDKVGPVTGDDPAQRQQSAAAIASRTGANVVIDGRVDFADPSSIKPGALLTATSFADSPELGGYYNLGAITYPGSYTNQVTKDQLVKDLSAATEALGQFIHGVSYYSVLDAEPGNPERAAQAFRAALRSPDLPTAAKEGAHAFLGSLALLKTDLAGAKSEFEAAVKLNPASPRGRLGLSEVALLQSSGNRCAASTVDAKGLDAAAAGFAAISPNGVDLPGVALKVELGRARALRCRSQAGLATDFPAVAPALRHVIAAAGTNHETQELAAEAHAELALTIAPEVGRPDKAALEASLAETKLAVATSHRTRNKAVYLWQEAFYLDELGRPQEASAALAEAAALDPSFRSVKLADLLPQTTGRVVPSGAHAPDIVSHLSVLPFTGQDPRPLLDAGLALLALGVALVQLSRRLPGLRVQQPSDAGRRS